MEGLNGVACWTFHNAVGMSHGCDKSLTPGWHTFASDWQPGSITYYYDGVNVGSVTSGMTSSRCTSSSTTRSTPANRA